MSGYFGLLAARALGDHARLAPPPRLRFGEAVDPDLTAAPVPERPVSTEAPPPAPLPPTPPTARPAPDLRGRAQQPTPARSARHEPHARGDDARARGFESRAQPASQPPIPAPSIPPPAVRIPAPPEAEPQVVRTPEPRADPVPGPRWIAPWAQPEAPEVRPHPREPDLRRQQPAASRPESSAVAQPALRPHAPSPPAVPLSPAHLPTPAAEVARAALDRPQVTISIAQIELRAAGDRPAPPPRPPEPAREHPRKPGLALDEYLEQRSRR